MNDYELRKINVWKNIFDAYREYFKENEKDTLFVYIDEICKYERSSKAKEQLINFLDDICIKEYNPILELHNDKFYTFIGYKENINFMKKLAIY